MNHSNKLYRKNGNGSFSRVDMPSLTDTLAPFTIPTWTDYDQDGDMDLFIGASPGGSVSTDFLYKNLLKETGTAKLVRLNLPLLSTDLVDGQVWNTIDYDNDGDLDAYGYSDLFVSNGNLTSQNNSLYLNNIAGGFIKISTGPIVNDGGSSIGATWGDYNIYNNCNRFIIMCSGEIQFPGKD